MENGMSGRKLVALLWDYTIIQIMRSQMSCVENGVILLQQIVLP